MTHVYTMTSGRTGTQFLARLFGANLTSALVKHEGMGPDDWGIRSPDIGLRMRFNTYGNIGTVKQWWENKLALDVEQKGGRKFYVETAHNLWTSGLIENLKHLDDKVKIINLRRNPTDVAVSMRARGDFGVNLTIPWAWYLDPRWPANATKLTKEPTEMNCILWFLGEVEARRAGYMRQVSNVDILDVDVKHLTNEGGVRKLLDFVGADQPKEIRIPPENLRNAGKHKRPDDYDDVAKMVALALERK